MLFRALLFGFAALAATGVTSRVQAEATVSIVVGYSAGGDDGTRSPASWEAD